MGERKKLLKQLSSFLVDSSYVFSALEQVFLCVPVKGKGALVQYKSLKLDRNGGKSKRSRTSFVASPVEELVGFYLRSFPE